MCKAKESAISNSELPIVVIGAGAAGLLAAIAAAQGGARVTVIEQLERPGVKLLTTGGGRCNLTYMCEHEEFMARLGRQGRFMQDALAAMDQQGVIDLLTSLEVPTYADGPRVYPSTNSASTVQQAFYHRAQDLGVEFMFRAAVTEIQAEPLSLGISQGGDTKTLQARAVIVATGGRSYAKLGGTGSGFELAQRLGHTVTPLTPSLVGLITREDWVRMVAGVSLPARVSIHGKGASKAGVAGDLLFTHRGISGPAVLDLSGDVAQRLERDKEVAVTVDLTGKTVPQWLEEFTRFQSEDGTKAVSTVLGRFIPQRLTTVICDQAAVDPQTHCAHLTSDARHRLATLLSAMPMTVIATEGWDKAMVTRGGVSLKQVDPRTMASRIVPGLYFAGEVLDLDGPSGGFNLQIAFSTGYVAGMSSAKA